MAGCFITFEGGEGAGKSTQIERLRNRLEQLGQPALVTREPGGSPHAEEIRAFILGGHAKHLGPFAEALLFAAARIDHLDKTIEPALKFGTHVLCDRFADSTRAYQGSLGNIDKDLIDQLETVTLRGVKPDLTLILDLPAETGLARAGARQAGKGEGADRFEEEDISFHQSLRQAYLSIAGAEPKRCAVIDADQDPNEVETAIWAALRDRLPQMTEHAVRPSMSRDDQDMLEPDRFEGAPHPREQFAFFGHREGEDAFLEGLRSGRLHHAWMIGGAQGIGKATLAYRVARTVLDPQKSNDRAISSLDIPADSHVARQVAAFSHPNLSVLRRAPASDKKGPSATIPVEAVRRALGMFGSTAADGGYRVCIVDSAEDLTISSANALLKVIEEPPPRSLFLIVSHAPQRVLPTIRSRCRRLLLRPLEDQDIKAAIASLGSPWSDIPRDLVDQALRYGEGSVRRTLELLDAEKVAFIDQVTRLLNGLPNTDTKQILALAEALSRRDADDSYELTLETVQRWVSERLHERAGHGAARLAPLVEVCEKIGRSARELDVFNLDRRPFILTMFDDLADAVRQAA